MESSDVDGYSYTNLWFIWIFCDKIFGCTVSIRNEFLCGFWFVVDFKLEFGSTFQII